jgi:glucose-6-phosphate 1-epimerase
MDYTVHNSGAQAFPFGVALHTYYDVGHLDATSISGLQHQQYTDHHLHTRTQEYPALHFTEKHDRLYQSTPSDAEHGRRHAAPGTARLQRMGGVESGSGRCGSAVDLADEEYLRFVCIEPARIDQRQLAAGSSWAASTASAAPASSAS